MPDLIARQMISVQADSRTYPIYIGQDLFSDKDVLTSHIPGSQVLIVTQEKIASLYLSQLQNLLSSYQCDVLCLPDGEQHKNLDEWKKILDTLLQQRHERSTTLIALGGGVIGDMTGFAAACYLRGVNYIQIPTTLIAQVDAAIGGKTAVNHKLGKNLVGAFYQPRCVIADINFLQSLPEREFRAGLAEVIKYGLMIDAEFFRWLEKNITSLLAKDSSALLHAIHSSAKIKADIVSQDEKDQGIRNLLNLGHTFGHALETAASYEDILHGEAVAIGMLMAAKLSAQLGWLTTADVSRISRLLKVINTESMLRDLPDTQDFLNLMRQDKKVRAGKINLILLKKIGEAVQTDVVTDAQIELMLKNFREEVFAGD